MDFCAKNTESKLRVLFLSYNGLLEPLLYSQGIIYLRELTRKLKINITVLSFEKVPFFLSRKQRKEIKTLHERLRQNNIQWQWLRYHKFPLVLSSLRDIVMGIIVCAKLVITKKVKFVHARSYVPASIAFILWKILRVRYIFDMRGFMIDDYVALGVISEGGLIKKSAKLMELAILRNASSIIVLTEEAKKIISCFRGIKSETIEIIPCCVDIKRFGPALPKDRQLVERFGLDERFVFIYVGSLGRLYQINEMLDFFKVARSIIPQAYFLIITPDTPQLLRQRAHFGNEELFENIGYLESKPDDVAKYIRLADAGLAFYLPSFSRKGTCPTKIGEYLASGIPFIVNAGIGDTEKWVDEFSVGVVIKDFRDDCYKEAVKNLLGLIGANNISSSCRNAAEKLLSLPIAQERYSAVYKSFLNAK